MTDQKHSVDLTPQEFQVIEAALHTQEKILAVQSRAGQDAGTQRRLQDLKSVLRNLRRQAPDSDAGDFNFGLSWSRMARGLFC